MQSLIDAQGKSMENKWCDTIPLTIIYMYGTFLKILYFTFMQTNS